jgi:hypothetical protein
MDEFVDRPFDARQDQPASAQLSRQTISIRVNLTPGMPSSGDQGI